MLKVSFSLRRGFCSNIRFEGFCKRCDVVHAVPSTSEAIGEARKRISTVERALRKSPSSKKGRMVGVLLGVDVEGKQSILQAYNGTKVLPGLEFGWASATRSVEITKTQEDETFLALNQLTRQIEGFSVKIKEARKSWHDECKKLKTGKRNLQKERAKQRERRALLRASMPAGAEVASKIEEQLNKESNRQTGEYTRQLKILKLPVEQAKSHLDGLVEQRLVLKHKRRDKSKSLQVETLR